MQYDVAQHKNLNDFFKRKALTFTKKYSLRGSTTKNISQAKAYSIKSITIKAVKGDDHLEIILRRDGKDEAILPKVIIKGKKFNSGKYHLSCHDDDIYILANDEDITLDDWLPSPQ